MKWVLLLGAVLAASAAVAQEDLPALPRYGLSLELPAFLSTGVEIDGERFFDNRHWSALAAVGGQWSFGSGDYTSQTYNVGGELRFWLNMLRFPFMKDIGGPFAAVRGDLALNRLLDHGTGNAFVSLQAQGTASIGYRLVFLHRIELTHWVGLSLTSNMTTQPQVVWGVPLGGWVFDLTLGYLF